ncbi:IS66 family insertion sequence element accessory protein TnpB [Oxalobacteraceae bacterium]|nr:IS66 family insertion sequence element accessory protein TnpB [Oxalobacteraceae bacterium]
MQLGAHRQHGPSRRRPGVSVRRIHLRILKFPVDTPHFFLYVFANRRRTRPKLVRWDGTGVWMCLRRLHEALGCTEHGC